MVAIVRTVAFVEVLEMDILLNQRPKKWSSKSSWVSFAHEIFILHLVKVV